MSAIILPDRWKRQPSYPAKVRPELRPIVAYNFASSFIADGGRSNLHATMAAGTFTPTTGKNGECVAWSGARTRYASSTGTLPPIASGTPITILARIQPTSADTSQDTVFQLGKYTADTEYHGKNCTLHTNIAGAGDVYWAHSGHDFYAASSFSAGQYIDVALVYLGGNLSTSSIEIYVDGIKKTVSEAGDAAVPLVLDQNNQVLIGRDNNSTSRDFRGNIDYVFAFEGGWNQAQIQRFREDPWSVYEKSARILYFPSAGGGGATGTGTPAAQSATVAGTATRTVTGSGTPTAQAATASGTAEREITSSGTLSAQSATVSGTGTVGAVVTGSGSPQAQSATVAGTATRIVTASGTPSAQSATVAGTAEREITSSGTPTAQSATVVGTGQVGNIITGSGTPTAQSATVSGTAEREITASGTVSASSATVVGTAEREITGSGTLSASSATVYGFDTAPVTGNPTSGGGTGKVYSSKKLRKEVDEWLEKQQEAERQKLLARLQKEDEELVVIMLALAA